MPEYVEKLFNFLNKYSMNYVNGRQKPFVVIGFGVLPIETLWTHL